MVGGSGISGGTCNGDMTEMSLTDAVRTGTKLYPVGLESLQVNNQHSVRNPFEEVHTCQLPAPPRCRPAPHCFPLRTAWRCHPAFYPLLRAVVQPGLALVG